MQTIKAAVCHEFGKPLVIEDIHLRAPGMGEIEVTGASARDSVQRIVTNDVDALEDGKALYTPMCMPSGGIVDDVILYRLAWDRYLFVVNASNMEKDLRWIREHAADPDSVADRSDALALLAVQGPASRAALERLTGRPLQDVEFMSIVSDVDVAGLRPQITYGTHPGMVVGIDEAIPAPQDQTEQDALDYMQVSPNEPLLGRPVDVVFVGSCTNGRLEDLRDAARMLRGRRVASSVRALIVPGSGAVQRQAEAEGLGDVFRAAGAEWAEPGCSLCLAMNGDAVPPGRYALSTSNRNFRGRQGEGSRTFLASPLTAAAAAVTGRITDPLELLS